MHDVAAEAARAAPVVARSRTKCDAGDMPACFTLGFDYEHGIGVARDATRARALYRKACEGGLQRACAAAK